MVLLGGILCLTAYAGFAFAPVAEVFIGSGLVLGLGMFMIHNSIQTRVTEVAPHARGTAVALHGFHFFLGQWCSENSCDRRVPGSRSWLAVSVC